MVFQTQSGSIYVLDEDKKVISGGKLAQQEEYVFARAICGLPGIIKLKSGETLKTNVIEKYLTNGAMWEEMGRTGDIVPKATEQTAIIKRKSR